MAVPDTTPTSMNTFHRATPERTIKTPAGRAFAVATLVLATHVGLLVIALNVQDRPVEKPVESQTITASLISETPAPVVTPAALQSSAPPQPAPPKSHPKPRPVEHHIATVRSTPSPEKPSDAPSPVPAAAADPAPAPDVQAAAPTAAATAPAISRATLAISAPKDVAHLDCNIAKPDYPYLSKRTNETGTAVIRFVVGLAGTIEEIRLQKSSGFARLDSAALDAMHASACHPYMEDGKPVRAAYSQPFTFSLAD